MNDYRHDHRPHSRRNQHDNHPYDYYEDNQADEPQTKSPGLSFLKYFATTISVTLLILSIAVLAWARFVQPPALPDTANPNPAMTRRPDFFTFLIFGYDEGRRTDTIMVGAYDDVTQQAYIISIPRDTRVHSSGGNLRRINAAYPIGLNRYGHAAGVDNLKNEVQTLVGFRPDFYVGLNEDVFVAIVDAVGGVYIDVPFRMHYSDPCQDLYIDLQEGHQRLDGEAALHFVRFRYHYDRRGAISNHLRMQHQHMLIDAMRDELMTPMTLLRIPRFIRAYTSYMSTDLSITNMLWFGQQLALGDISIDTYNYPVTSVRSTAWYDIANGREALELINRTINPFTQDITMDMLRLAGS